MHIWLFISFYFQNRHMQYTDVASARERGSSISQSLLYALKRSIADTDSNKFKVENLIDIAVKFCFPKQFRSFQ